METLTKTTVNGFKSEEMVGTINAIQENPAIAKFEFRVRNKWITGGHNQATVKNFYDGARKILHGKRRGYLTMVSHQFY